VRQHLLVTLVALAALGAGGARAAPTDDALPDPQSATALPGVSVTGANDAIESPAFPGTTATIDASDIDATVNAVDVEDAVKYLPSLFVRKRNYGDTQPVLATRTTGLGASARSLVYADDILLSALIANNNTIGAPRWGLVAPEEIQRVDFLYGPFSAAWPGNSVGGVLLITTRMPDKLEWTLKQTEALQTFGYYDTYGSYLTSNSAGTIGDKVGRLSFFLAVNREESFSQPLAFVTNGGAFAAGTSGTIPALTKTGTAGNVVGAGGLLHSIMDNYKLKLAVDLNDWLKASYTIGYWDNTTFSTVQSYLTTGNGTPTFGGVSGFANNTYNLGEQHLMHALSLKTDTGGNWDWELIATRYDYLQSLQRSPAGVTTGTNYTTNGLIARMDGTGWMTQDVKAIWRPTGLEGPHELSAGFHHDQYKLENPTWNAPSWLTSPDNGNNTVSTYGRGKTETWALWLQEAWSFAPGWKLTIGGRGETGVMEGHELRVQITGGAVEAFELMGRMGVDFALKNVAGTRDPLTEIHPWYVLAEFSSGEPGSAEASMERFLASGLEDGLIRDAVVAQTDAQAKALWAIRENQSPAQKPEGATWKHDVSVPVSQVAAFLDKATAAMQAFAPGARIAAFGHMGDGNIHYDVLRPDGGSDTEHAARRDAGSRIVHDIVASMGGSISAEHGLGSMKTEEARRYKSAVEIEALTAIRRALDPKRIMNPRVLF